MVDQALAGPTVWFPDYSRAYASGVCQKGTRAPNGIVSYDSQEECCRFAYGSQHSNACVCDLPNPPSTCPIREVSAVTMSLVLRLAGLDCSSQDISTVAALLESSIRAATSSSMESDQQVVEVKAREICGRSVRRLRGGNPSEGNAVFDLVVRGTNACTGRGCSNGVEGLVKGKLTQALTPRAITEILLRQNPALPLNVLSVKLLSGDVGPPPKNQQTDLVRAIIVSTESELLSKCTC